MKRKFLLAAEMYSYSYANYDDHRGVNIRFDELMPRTVDLMEKAEREDWSDAEMADVLEIPEEEVGVYKENYIQAKHIVDALNAAISFRRSVRYSIQHAVKEGLKTKENMEKLVMQICYNAADMAYLLDLEGRGLSTYSEELRKDIDEFEDDIE